MAKDFRKTILKLLSATNYPVDNLSEDDINTFKNLSHLKPMFEWFNQNVSEANCITPEEMEEFKKLQQNGKVKYGDELEEAVEAHSSNEGESVPFKESLNDAEEELALLKEQLHYKQALYQSLCTSNAVVDGEICDLVHKEEAAKVRWREVMKDICSAKKALQDSINEHQANVNELRDNIIDLAPNEGDVSLDEGIHSLTSGNLANKSFRTSVWSLTTSSSWQTINSKSEDIKFQCQQAFDRYQRTSKHFMKKLKKLIENLSKVDKSHSDSMDRKELCCVVDSLEKQMFTLIATKAKLEGIQAVRAKVQELRETALTPESLLTKLKYEEKELKDNNENESFSSNSEEEVAAACRRWVECEVWSATKHKLKDRIEYSRCLLDKMEEVLKPMTLKRNADNVLLDVLHYELERIRYIANLYRSFHQSLKEQTDVIKKRIELMQNNFEDFKQFCSLPLEKRNDLVQKLASILSSDNEGVVHTVQHLTESARREHETMYEHYVQVKNELITRGEKMEESCHTALAQCRSNVEAPEETIEDIQRGLDQMDDTIVEVNSYLQEVIECFTAEGKKNL